MSTAEIASPVLDSMPPSTSFSNLLDPLAINKMQFDNSLKQTPLDYEKTQKVFDNNQEQQKLCKKVETKKWYHILATQAIIALIPSGITVLLLYIFNPPMTQLKRTDDMTSEKQDWKKVLALTVFVFLITLLLPEVIRLIAMMIYKR
jgi:hypothetical protein